MKIEIIIKNLNDYLFYSNDYCLVCKEEECQKSICSSCLSHLEFVDGRFKLENSTCYYPLFYNNFIQQIIREFKFNNKTYYVFVLAEILQEFMLNTPELQDVDYISYIPMTRFDEFNRGYNQAKILAQTLADLLQIPCLQVLEKVKRTREQNKISLQERADNLSGAYGIISECNLENKKLLLVDDLVTSGKTMDTAIATIKDSYQVDVVGLALTSSRIGEDDD